MFLWTLLEAYDAGWGTRAFQGQKRREGVQDLDMACRRDRRKEWFFAEPHVHSVCWLSHAKTYVCRQLRTGPVSMWTYLERG